MKLRNYQEDNVGQIRAHLRSGVRSVLWQLATGGGKTAGATFMASGAASRGKTVWFAVHRKELLEQSSEAFREHGLPHGLIAAGYPYNFKAKVFIVAIGTVARRLGQVPPPDMIIWDECHHLAAGSWKKIYDFYPNAIHVGLSATPCRLDRRGLSDFFQQMVIGPSTAELIRRNYLKPYRLFGSPHAVDLTGVGKVAGDLNLRQLADRMDKPQVYGDAVDHYREVAFGRNALLFDINRKMSEQQAQAFRDAGIPAAHIDSETDATTRRRAIKDLERDHLKVICNVDLFGEGVSVNRVSCVIGKRRTQSLSLALQQVGRGLRLFPGQSDCILLDHAGNWTADGHGFPCDEREWTLDGVAAAKNVAPPEQTRECPKCFCRFRMTSLQCPECGTEIERRFREVEQVAGKLEEINVEAARAAAKPKSEAMKSQAKARTADALLELFTMQKRQRCAEAGIPFDEAARAAVARRVDHVMNARRNGYGQGQRRRAG